MKLNNLIVFLMMAGLLSCGGKEELVHEEAASDKENTVTLTEVQMKNAGIVLGKPEAGTMASTLKLSGVVDVPPQSMVSISFPIGGYLKSTHLLPGTRVRKGELIAVMEDQGIIQVEQDYLIAKQKMSMLEKEYERQRVLNESKSVSDKVFEQTANDFKVQKIMYKSLRERLLMIGVNPDKISEDNISRTLNIYSPINGYVARVNVNIGKFVDPSEILFELVNPEDLHLALKVFEKDIHNIKIGQHIRAYKVNAPQHIYEAEVILVSKNLDENRTAIIHCHFEKHERELLPGMFLNAEIEIANDKAVLVPDDAVVRYGDGQFLVSSKGKGVFELVPVKVGNSDGTRVEVSSDEVNLMDLEIVVTNAYAVLMKMHNTGEEE